MTERANGEPRYPVRVVTTRTGLTADVLRAWERRYRAVRPRRSAGGQRLYSDEDVERLTLLRRATGAGHRIAEIARLDIPALEALLDDAMRAPAWPPDEGIDALVATAVAAAERLDGPAIERTLKRGTLALGATALVDHVVSRFLHEVGDRGHAGTLGPAHEHLASEAVRRVLGWATDAYASPPRAPRIVVATPAGELHEFGAVLAGAAALEEGWRVVYLGPNLPAAQIAAAAAQVGARAVALSAVYASAGESPAGALRDVARALPPGTALLVGGAAAVAEEEALRDAGARVVADIPALRRALRALRAAAPVEEGGESRAAR